MKLPKWAGRTLSVSVYTLRFYWFRCFLILALGVLAASGLRPELEALISRGPPTRPEARLLASVASPPTSISDETESRALVDVFFEDILLEEALDRLRIDTELNIVLTDAAMEEMRDEGMRVRLFMRQARVEDVLALLLWGRDSLALRWGPHRITVLAAGELPQEQSLRVYEVGDLAVDCERLETVLLTVIDDAFAFLKVKRGQLFARVDSDAQRAIESCLAAVRASPNGFTLGPRSSSEEDHENLELVLETLDWRRRGLGSVAMEISRLSGRPVLISPEVDWESLTTTLALNQVSVKDLLDAVTEQHELTWRRLHGAAVMMSTDEAKRIETRRIETYFVGDLIDENLEGDVLIELVRGASGEDAWEDPAKIEAFAGRLIVRQSLRVHADIRATLAKMRSAKRGH